MSREAVYFENHPVFTLSEDEETVLRYSLVLGGLLSQALSEEESRAFIASLAGP
ncbi:Scr1 family TA system antitoxin-like transcriptional regulator [Nonomuraea longispora]|uniref:Scr1 family TA system antitoxin-like transcriptional regulator n=1 Tax=Nonomuraea longispora TaxID=1848320 RepID=UPI001C709929